VLDLLNEIVDRPAPVLANRTLAALRKLFNWCKGQDILAHEHVSPCAFLEPPTTVEPRDRVLSDDEIRLFWHAWVKNGYPFGYIGKLLVLTGQRESEVAGMTSTEINGSEWIIPRERAKNNHLHVVPLSEAASEIIHRLPQISGPKRFLFTTTGNTPVSGFSRAKSRIDKLMGPIPPWRFHDLRRTVATGLQRLHVPQEVTDAVLSHRSGKISGISAVYQKHHYADEKRSALDAWANFVLELVGARPAANVVPIRESA
jgi:integrase